ncbi:cytochrome P450/oxidoreductase [Microbacterium radiodurans]|nr:cytochrome P450 [Microbacterium radiodurans]
MTTFLDDITLDELEADPYPTYARLRREAPVAWVPAADVWFVSTFDDCAAIGRGDHGFAGATNHPTLQRVFGKPDVLSSGGDTHTDLRKGIDPPLQPKPVNAMVDDLVRPIARRQLEPLRARSGGELMAEYFEPVSVGALRTVMGLDGLVDSDTLRRWFRDLNAGASNFGLDPEVFATSDRASAEIEDVLRPVLERLRLHPDESMLSHMLWAGREGDAPRPVELILPSLKVILLGGMQEPGHAAGSTLHGLFGEPDQLRRLIADPEELIPLAVHEGMRWIAPIGAVERQATSDVVVRGQRIPAGAIVQVILGSANRDETRFDDPDRFDMERSNRVNQAFGNGEHFCAGHFFARQVQHIMFEELVAALPGLRPDPHDPARVTGWVFRAPKRLGARWEATAAAGSAITGATPARPAPDTRELQVTSMRREADGILSIELTDPAGADLPAWQPGAHIDVWPTDRRAGQYSLCGNPADRSRYVIAVLREAASRGVSAFVHEHLRVGDLLTVGGPRNNFSVEPGTSPVFVAGGIGITPILAMARAAAAAAGSVAVHYGGRERARMAFVDEVARLGPSARCHVSSEGDRLDIDAVVAEAAESGRPIYACGPQGLLDELERVASACGVEVVVEHFDGATAHTDADRAFDLVLARSQRTLHVAPDRTAMEALEEAGMDIRFACREGNCGSCETAVLAGGVDHRDVILTPAQRRRGDRMMVCVSRAAGSEVTLDI